MKPLHDEIKIFYVREYNYLETLSFTIINRITYFFNSDCVERISSRKLYNIWKHLGQTTQGKTNYS